jgi:ABC-type multidrug transport system fused ATPase/permease subunit
VMDKGEIIEQGTHQQLRAQNGVYASMWQLQQSHTETNNVV